MSCKFCQRNEGDFGRTGTKKPVHINRDMLCGPCATLLDKVKYQPDKVDKQDTEWFERQCRYNFEHGYFVPVAQRKQLRATVKQKWSCKRCNTTNEANRDVSYTNYCVSCADDIRRNRVMPNRQERKTRSDKGGTHFRPTVDVMYKTDRRLKG